MITLEELKAYLISNQLAQEQDIVGVSEEGILALETQLGKTLPDFYRAFLLLMGQKAGIFLSGEYVFEHSFGTILKYSKEFSELAFNGEKKARFVFWANLGDEFAYFNFEDSVVR